MKPISLVVACIVVASAAMSPVHADNVIIDFDGFAPTFAFPGGVEDGFLIGSISGPVAVNSDYLGPFSGPNSIHHDTAGPASFTLTNVSATPFRLESFYAGSAFGGAEPLIISGFLNGSLVGSDTYDPNPPDSYIFFTPTNLAGVMVDTLVFDLGPAGPGPTHVDDIELTTIPEPSTTALLGACLIGAWIRRRR